MRFMMLVKASQASEASVLPDEKILSEMGRYNEKLVQAGALLAAEGLQASAKGVRVRCAGGQVKVTDGPFAETKELVAGFWLIQAKSLTEAVDWAKRAPFQEGEVEIRPLFEVENFPVDPAEKPGGWREKEEQFRATPPPRKPGTIRFMGLLKGDRDTEAGVMPNEKLLAAMGAFFEEGMKSGLILSGEGLLPTSKGARVRYSGAQRTVIDGPFAESKELIAGYAILQAKSRQEAIEWTKRFVAVDAPGRADSVADCELRQVFELEDFPVHPAEKPDGWRKVEETLRNRGR